MCELHLTGV